MPKPTQKRPDRLIVFGSPYHGMSCIPAQAFAAEVASRADIQLTAICDTDRRPPKPHLWVAATSELHNVAMRLFNPSRRRAERRSRPRSLYEIARLHGAPVIVPPRRDINDPEFIRQLRQEWKPTIGIVSGCMQIFRQPLIDSFVRLANLHDGLLPNYRGLYATNWSMYLGEFRTGYTYHLVTEGIDAGPVLVQKDFPIQFEDNMWDVVGEKWRRAAGDAGQVLDLLVARSEGTPQAGQGSCFSRADMRELCTIEDPARLPADEIRSRIRCFGVVQIRFGGKLYPVTAIKSSTTTRAPLAFESSDGKPLRIHRCMCLPPWLYRLYSALPFVREP